MKAKGGKKKKKPESAAALRRQLRNAEKKLRALEQEKDAFISIISHELRTPLSVIKGYLELAADGILGEIPKPLQEPILKSKENADRLHRLINNLLDISRLESGELAFKWKSVSLHALISNTIAEQDEDLKKKKLQLKLNLEDDLPLVLADEEKIRRVLQHLMRNAINHSPRNGKITVEAKPAPRENRGGTEQLEDQRVEISVHDMGKGIPSGMEERVFDRFFQGENPLTRQKNGAGLGLYYCKQVVEQHGGEIRVESSPRKGARFIFLISVDPLLKKECCGTGKN